MGSLLEIPDMARIRSPNYPAISLKETLERVAKVHERERQHPANKEVVIKGMGYSAIHGTSLGALSAALKYGLLEQDGRGQDYRVSDRALAILHPHSAEEKARALEEAAHSPQLFAELLDHFKGELPSDDNLRAYLVRRGFTTGSLAAVIQSFRDTMELVSAIETPHNVVPLSGTVQVGARGSTSLGASASLSGGPPPQAARKEITVPMYLNPPTLSEGEPYRVTFTGAGIEVTGRLNTEADADGLIKAIDALKGLIRAKVLRTEPDASEK